MQEIEVAIAMNASNRSNTQIANNPAEPNIRPAEVSQSRKRARHSDDFRSGFRRTVDPDPPPPPPPPVINLVNNRTKKSICVKVSRNVLLFNKNFSLQELEYPITWDTDRISELLLESNLKQFLPSFQKISLFIS